VLTDWRTAPVDEKTRAILGLLETVTLRPEQLTAADFNPAHRAGVTDEAIEQALHVCALFSIYTRLADSLGFDIPPAEAFSKSADMLLKRGYR
jgi:alkylhydroperoxidase family enzyme